MSEAREENPAEKARLAKAHEGELEKLSPKLGLGIWQKRYFVISHSILRYYKNRKDCYENKPPKGILNFQQVQVDYRFQQEKRIIEL